MEDGLARSRADVVHRAVAVLDAALARNLRRYQVRVPDNLRVLRFRFLQAANVLLGNDQHVRRRLRVNVLDYENMLVLVNLLAGCLAGNHVAEETVGHKRKWSVASGQWPAISLKILTMVRGADQV